MRAVPLEWATNRMAAILREAPITRDGLNYFQYKESRAVGYEADAEANEAKAEARRLAIEDGKVTGEDFDKSFSSTTKAWYVQTSESLHNAMDTLDALQRFCEEKYGDDGPGFGKFRTALEEVANVVDILLGEKRKLEPDAGAEEPVEFEPEPEAEAEVEAGGEAQPAAGRSRAGKSMSAEPVDHDDAIARIQVCAKFLHAENPSNPVAYMLQSALRFGEMREQGGSPTWDFLAAPSTEQRQNLRRLSAEGNWSDLLSAAVAAVGEPCGRGWLDVHRYVWRASYESSYYALTASVVSTLQTLLKDIPELPTWTLSDDTPTANPDTLRWLEETVIPKPPEPVAEEAAAAEPAIYTPAPAAEAEASESVPPDVLAQARELMGRGQLPLALQLLMRDAAQQPSGRARYLRRLQMAQLCMSAGQGKVAFPVLQELVKEFDQRQLEEWEAIDMIAPPLALLLRCLDRSDNNGMRETVFARLCRIDPIAAMEASR
jgi:type VI secretion system protein ImpA